MHRPWMARSKSLCQPPDFPVRSISDDPSPTILKITAQSASVPRGLFCFRTCRRLWRLMQKFLASPVDAWQRSSHHTGRHRQKRPLSRPWSPTAALCSTTTQVMGYGGGSLWSRRAPSRWPLMTAPAAVGSTPWDGRAPAEMKAARQFATGAPVNTPRQCLSCRQPCRGTSTFVLVRRATRAQTVRTTLMTAQARHA